jgi:hypothetical protein
VIRWVLLLLVALNLAYLGFSRFWTPDPYAGVAPMERLPHAVEIRLIESVVDPPPHPVQDAGGPPPLPDRDDEAGGQF